MMLRLLMVVWTVTAIWVTVASAAPQDDSELLEQYKPVIWYESGHPSDWITSYVRDDIFIEDNFDSLHSAANVVEICYANVYTTLDANNRSCKVLEYHYYYPRNFNVVYTHEHDWEWIYIVLGEDDPGTFRPYVACYSFHDDDNLGAIANGHYRFFQNVFGGSLWDDRVTQTPRVYLYSTDRVQALSLLAGNAFEGGLGQLGSGQLNTDYFLAMGYETPYSSYPCESGEGPFYYGDPRTTAFWDDCADGRPAPWNRTGLWNNSPLPGGFALPAPGEWENDPGTSVQEVDVSRICVGPNPTRGVIYLTSVVELEVTGIALFDVTGRRAIPSRWWCASDRSWVDVRGLPVGIWYMLIESSKGSKEVYRVAVIR